MSGLIDFPLVMVANPVASGEERSPTSIAHAKANPGKISIGSFGTGSTSHVAGELFKMMTGVNMIHVPYRGGAAMVADLIGGQVQVGIDVLTGSLAHIRSGTLRALAVAGQGPIRRAAGCPDHRRDGGGIRGEFLVRRRRSRAARHPRSSSGSTARSMPGWPIRP